SSSQRSLSGLAPVAAGAFLLAQGRGPVIVGVRAAFLADGCVFRCRENPLLLHAAYFSTTPGMPEGRATSRGSTFSPPAICGCDGSKPSRNSRLNTSERAIKKASFRLLARRSAALKKASPK